MTYTMEIPDDARLEDGYIEFSGEPYLILQKRDDDGNIIAEKEIHETLENSEITSGCHGKENEEEEKKPVKSSLEEFEEGYSNALTEDPMDFEDRIINLINDLTRLRQELDDAAYGDAGVTDAIIALRHQLKAARMPGAVKSSRKLIKSSLDERLVPYLEEFEEGYANAITRDSEEASEFEHVYEDTFFEQFKSDYNLTDTDIQKLDKAVREIWDASSTEEGEVRDMGEMYGAPRGATSEEALKHFE